VKLLLFVLYSNSLFLGTDELTDLYVEKVLNSPVIDGELNDECWKELKIIMPTTLMQRSLNLMKIQITC